MKCEWRCKWSVNVAQVSLFLFGWRLSVAFCGRTLRHSRVIGRQIKSAETQEHFFPLAVLDRMVASLHFSLFGARASGGKSMAVFLKPLDSIRQELPVCDVLLPPDLYGSITDEGSSSPHHSQSGWRVKKRDERERGQKEPTGFLYFPFYIRPLFTTGLLSSSSAARSMIKFPSRAKREEWPQNKKRRKNPAAKYNSIMY